jgi:hypothetical protein
VFVCDRENSRVQVFSPAGQCQAVWNVAGRPNQLTIDRENHVFMSVWHWVAGERTFAGKMMTESAPAHLCICDLEGNLLAKWGKTNYGQMDSFVNAHGMCMDSQGNWYVAENGKNGFRNLGLKLPSYRSLRKLVRLR